VAKTRPKTGEAREVNQPLKIDRLPSYVHDAILYLRNKLGKTWEEIEAQSAEKYNPDWKSTSGPRRRSDDGEDGKVSAVPADRGFVDWVDLPIAVLELFPDMRLPHSTVHRWYDLRVTQVQRDVLLRSKQAQEIAKAFVKANLVNDDQGVINAARDTLMGILAEDSSSQGRKSAAGGLIKLGELMQSAKQNEIRQRKVAVDERKIVQMEKDAEARRSRMEHETENAAVKLKKGELTLEDINKLRKNTFGLPPLAPESEGATAA
jgi:hypothetical protein